MSLNLTFLLNNVSAIFFTPTLDWAIIQPGSLRSTHVAAAAAIVVVFPVPGGPVRSECHQQEETGCSDSTVYRERLLVNHMVR
jgi:hypothetical protein